MGIGYVTAQEKLHAALYLYMKDPGQGNFTHLRIALHEFTRVWDRSRSRDHSLPLLPLPPLPPPTSDHKTR